MTPQDLRHYRRQKGLSQQAFAESVGISFGALKKYEAASRPVPEDLPLRVALHLRDSDLLVRLLSVRMAALKWSATQVEEMAKCLVSLVQRRPSPSKGVEE